jgi:hypothetical protein
MKARLTIMLAGHPMRDIGEIVEGPEAARFIAAGFAVPVDDDPETASITPVVEKAVRAKRTKAE